MKARLLFIALMFIVFISNAQNEPVKPSGWSETTVDSTLSKLDLEDALKARNLENGDAYIDSLTAVMPPISTTDTDTLNIDDIGNIRDVDSEFNLILYVPINTFPVGITLNIANNGTGTLTIASVGGVTLDAKDNKTGVDNLGIVTIYQRALNDWRLYGGI